MANTKSVKRYSVEDAQSVITKLKKYPFDYLHQLFKEGRVPTFSEIEGDTLGSIIAWNHEAGWWPKVGWAFIGDNPFARWEGKRFITPFAKAKKGKAINLFRNHFLPQRYRMDISIEKSVFDQKPCLIITYPYYPSRLYGLRDELRMIDDGVFLGQGHHRHLRGKRYSLQSYFALCALNTPH